jgi:hypothetical protein
MNHHAPHPAPAGALRSIRAFVWDLADEGIDEVVGRLQDLGLDGLHLALAYHGGRFYCPHNPRRAMVHAPDGALYFQPLISCYEGIRPRVHPEYGSGAFAARVGEALREAGMTWTAWIVLFNNMTLSQAHPDMACINALGDRLEGTLCPSHPAVRGYAQALAEDLAHRVGVQAIEMEDFAFPCHQSYVGPVWRDVTIGPWLGYLMSLCFCESCRRRAEEDNIEVDDLKYHAERMIRAGLDGDASDRRIGDQIADPYHPLSRFAAVRAETITTLLDEIIDAVRGSGTVLQPVLCDEPDDAWRWGVQLHALRQRGLRATLKRPGRPCLMTPEFVERYMDLLQLGGDLAVDIRLRACEAPGEPSPAALLAACERLGIERFVFSHYGLASLEALDAIAQPRARR